MENKNTQLKIRLQSFGFSEKETDVYIGLLELGKGTVSKISLQAGINRTTGYDILASLVSKKLVTISGKEPKQEYAAEPPISITDYLKRQIAETEVHIKETEKILPELDLLYTFENRPKIRFYEGIEGIKHIYEESLMSSETILAYAAVDDIEKTVPDYFRSYRERRAKKGIPIRAIFPNTKEAIERKSHDIEEKREAVLVPKETYNFSPEINIYDNKVMIASWREKLGITIESEEIAEAMKKIYELAWGRAKELEKEMGK